MGAPWKGTDEWSIAERVSEWTGYNMAIVLLAADAERLRQTDIAQLSIFTASMMGLAYLRRVRPAVAETIEAYAGHSVGECTALVAAGALSLRDGARLVARRGSAMRTAARRHPGTMAVLAGDLDAVQSLVDAVGAEVWVANVNDPRQVVVSGAGPAVEEVVDAAHRMEMRTIHIMVAGAFHTPLMMSAVPALREAVKEANFTEGHAPVAANVDGLIHRGREWRDLLIRQLTAPVQWQGCIEQLVQTWGCDTIVEIGPRRTLTGTIRRSGLAATSHYAGSPHDIEQLSFG